MEEVGSSNLPEPTLLYGISHPSADKRPVIVSVPGVSLMSEVSQRIDLDELRMPVCEICGDRIEEPDQQCDEYDGVCAP